MKRVICYLIVLIIVLVGLTLPAMAQDTTLTDSRNNVNVAIIKLGAMVELNNQRILQLNRDAARFDDQMQTLKAQAKAIDDQIARAKAATRPEPDNKNP